MNQNNLLDCPELLREFLFYMETIKGRSSRTVDAYYIDLRLYLRFLKAKFVLGVHPTSMDEEEFRKLEIRDLSPSIICGVSLGDVYEYLNFTLSNRQNNANTRSRKVSSIRVFYKYITTKTELLEMNPVKDLEVPAAKKALPKYLTLEESIELLGVIDGDKNPRDYCMITLMLNCGMRVSELTGINLQDVRGETLRLLGKGNKERIIYINPACVEAIEAWLAVRPDIGVGKEKNAMFLSRGGRRISTRRVEQITEGYLKMAGLSGRGISPHKLRHTAATLMYQNGGADVRVLKEILGHANLATTEIYTHVSNQQMKTAMDSSPLAKVKKGGK